MKLSSRILGLAAGVASFIFAPSAWAIIDSNNNGLSDIWERHYNGGALFSPSNPHHAPTADPDGDGWNNAKEALAGTDPFNQALPLGCVRTEIVQHPDAEGLFILSWPSIQGKLYKLQVSSNLSAWAYFGEVIEGTGADIQLAVDAKYEDNGFPQRLFWKVKIEDDDADGDSLTTWEELALGTDPTTRDTDLDGIPDNLDPSPLENGAIADPDGSNPPAGSTTNLRGFWDFESLQGPGYPMIFPDRSGANRHATSSSGGPNLDGMPSKAGRIGPGYIEIPPSTVQGQAAYTVSGWFKIGKNAIQNSDGNYRAIYALYDRNGTSPHGHQLGQGTGLFVRKTVSGETWLVGGYRQSTLPNGNPTTDENGRYFTRPAGSTDDGKWHHFAVTRSATSNGQRVYIDGQLMVQGGLLEYLVDFDAGTTFTFGQLYPGHFPTAISEGFIDRLRVNSRLMSQADILALYNQDIDYDGLTDIRESRTGVWRDANSNAIQEPGETTYLSSPFVWQGSDHDTDGDGLSDADEVLIGTDIGNPDSDGDLIPDGWEHQHGLNPLDPSDADDDPDMDGLTNLQEWQYNTDPHNANSDGGDPENPDNTNDGDEVDQGSDPNDPGDGGQPPAEGEKLAIHLAVGDQSGSESEDYVLHCYKIDRQTGAEKRIYTVRSGGYGEYKEEDPDIFRRGETYTFQISWQGSSLATRPASPGVTAEGPDFDYTFKVIPESGAEGALLDSYDPKSGQFKLNDPILGVADDVADFRERVEKRRVVFLAAQPVLGEPGTSSEQLGDWSTAEAYPKPEVEMTVSSAQISGTSLQVTLQGTVTDPVSRFSSGPWERPQTLKFLQDGQQIHSIPIGSSVSNGFAFNETITIPNAKPVSYLIRAETTPNAAGLTGFDQAAVSLTWHENAADYPALSAPLSIYFPTAPSSGVVDQATVYVGSGSPPGGSGTATETAANSGEYAGTLVIPATPTPINATCAFRFTVPRTFSTTAADSIVLDFSYTASGFPANRFYGRWLETGANTRIFRPHGWFFGNQSLKVAYTQDLPGSHTTLVQPATLRLPALPGQKSDGGGIKISSGGADYSLIKINGAWYPKDPLKPGSAKLFLPASVPVPIRLESPGYDSGSGELSFKIKLNASTEVDAPTIYVLPGTFPEDNGGGMTTMGGPPMAPMSGDQPWAPGQPVQVHQMIWAYKLIHADDSFALELLDGYLRGGHQIETGDFHPDLDLDVTLNDIFTDSDNIWTIQIEEDWNPVYCARLLFEGLKKASVYAEVYNNYEFEDPFDDVLAFKTALDAAVNQTGETAVFATQLYLSGFGIINEGLWPPPEKLVHCE